MELSDIVHSFRGFFPAALLFAVYTEVSCRELSKIKCEYFYYSFVQYSKRN